MMNGDDDTFSDLSPKRERLLQIEKFFKSKVHPNLETPPCLEDKLRSSKK